MATINPPGALGAPLVPRMCLRASPDTTVARVALGLTLYLADPFQWLARGAGAALRELIKCAPPSGPVWYTTSMLSVWRPVRPSNVASLADQLSSPSILSLRHGFRFRLTDDLHAPSYGFEYREIDFKREASAGVLEVTLPQDFEPAEFLPLATKLANTGPFWCGIGGYVARWNEFEKATAFWQIFKWCRRYLGLDVQDSDRNAWEAIRGLPGSNWLTFIGRPLAEAREIKLGSLQEEPWRAEVEFRAVPNGAMLRAGTSPTLGDVNRLEFPYAYAEVSRRLAPFFKLPDYWGGFYNDEGTARWMRRFAEPARWT